LTVDKYSVRLGNFCYNTSITLHAITMPKQLNHKLLSVIVLLLLSITAFTLTLTNFLFTTSYQQGAAINLAVINTATSLSIGDKVVTVIDAEVKKNPNTAVVEGIQPKGSSGVVTGIYGTRSKTNIKSEIWINVDYDSGVDGWTLSTSLSERDTMPPTLTILSPREGVSVNGFMFEVEAKDNVAVSKVEFLVDKKVVATLTQAPYRTYVGTGGIAITTGSHTFGARAYDTEGNVTTIDPPIVINTPTIVRNPDGSVSIRFTFAGVVGNSYEIQKTISLTPPITWVPITTIVANTDGLIPYLTPAVEPSGFFRIIATPIAPTTHALTVTKSGQGTVNSITPYNIINCGTQCTASFVANTSVTLRATQDTGSTFTGWTGACLGTGDCVAYMDQPKTVTANFSLQLPGPVISDVRAERLGIIRWKTDVPSDSLVEFGRNPAYGQSTALNPTLTTDHVVNLNIPVKSLSDYRFNNYYDGMYHFRVHSRGVNGSETISKNYEFYQANPTGRLRVLEAYDSSLNTLSELQDMYEQLDDFWVANSYGKVYIDPTDILPLPADYFCGQLPVGVDIANYDLAVTLNRCVGGGLHRSGLYGLLVHEDGHALGLGHANAVYIYSSGERQESEYGNGYSPMGIAADASFTNPNIVFDSAHRETLGWLTEDTVPGIRRVTQSGTYTITNIQINDTGYKALKIPKALNPITGKYNYLYLELHPKVSIDGQNKQGPGVLVIEANTPQYPNLTPTFLRTDYGSLVAGNTVSDPVAGVNITVLSVSSESASIRVDFTKQPQVHIISPQKNDVFRGPSSVTLTAEASAPEGISSVTFYSGAAFRKDGYSLMFGVPINELGTVTTLPYTLQLYDLKEGAYPFITAKATSNTGRVNYAEYVPMYVEGNVPIQTSITAPNHGQSFISPATFTIEATAIDPLNQGIAKVEFLLTTVPFNLETIPFSSFPPGVTKLGEDTTAPYTFTATNIPPPYPGCVNYCSYYLYSLATGVKGNMGASPYRLIYVSSVP